MQQAADGQVSMPEDQKMLCGSASDSCRLELMTVTLDVSDINTIQSELEEQLKYR